MLYWFQANVVLKLLSSNWLFHARIASKKTSKKNNRLFCVLIFVIWVSENNDSTTEINTQECVLNKTFPVTLLDHHDYSKLIQLRISAASIFQSFWYLHLSIFFRSWTMPTKESCKIRFFVDIIFDLINWNCNELKRIKSQFFLRFSYKRLENSCFTFVEIDNIILTHSLWYYIIIQQQESHPSKTKNI